MTAATLTLRTSGGVQMEDRAWKDTRPWSRLGSLALGLLALALAHPALAVDGVIEINQSRALAGGVTAGDFAGYPVNLTTSGSYRLTSDLNVSVNNNGITIDADDVTLDLNGFTINSGGGVVTDGISIANHRNVEIRNGTIRGFTRNGIFTNIGTHFIRVIGLRTIGNTIDGIDLQGTGNTIDGCTSLNNGAGGMRAFEGSLVINSVARGNGAFGLTLIGPGGYRSNVLTGNNGGDANAQVSGGLQLGPNVCGIDLVCP
jgi:hypothetical protein